MSGSSQRTVHFIGWNCKKVEKMQKCRKHGTPEIQEAVKNDTMTINRAYKLIREMDKKENNSGESLSASHIRTLKSVMSSKNFTGLKGLGDDIASHLDKAVERYLRQLQHNRPGEEPAVENRTA